MKKWRPVAVLDLIFATCSASMHGSKVAVTNLLCIAMIPGIILGNLGIIVNKYIESYVFWIFYNHKLTLFLVKLPSIKLETLNDKNLSFESDGFKENIFTDINIAVPFTFKMIEPK